MRFVLSLFMVLALSVSSFATTQFTGSESARARVYGGYNNTHTTTFIGGLMAGVTISGDGDTDLDLYVYDQNGNTICTSTASGDDETCTWTPFWTGRFKIVVVNRGTLYNNYTITAY